MRFKKFLVLILVLFNFSGLVAPVFAQSVLPDISEEISCDEVLNANSDDSKWGKLSSEGIKNLLGCAIKEGRISFSMVPYFIKYIAEFILGVMWIFSVLFIVIGGYFYIWGGVSDEKEKGKKTIINALVGLIIASLGWVIVSAIMYAITS